MNTPLDNILKHYADASQSQREKGTYFEYLIQDYENMQVFKRANTRFYKGLK